MKNHLIIAFATLISGTGNTFSSRLMESGSFPLLDVQTTSERIESCLTELPPKETNVIIMLDADGKGQLMAVLGALSLLENQLRSPLSKYFDGIIGVGSGSIVAAGIALGKNLSEIGNAFKETRSQMLYYNDSGDDELCSCCGFGKKTLRDSSYSVYNSRFAGNYYSRVEMSPYDAFIKDAQYTQAISNLYKRKSLLFSDLCIISSKSPKTSIHDQVLSSIKERDDAAKENCGRLRADIAIEIAARKSPQNSVFKHAFSETSHKKTLLIKFSGETHVVESGGVGFKAKIHQKPNDSTIQQKPNGFRVSFTSYVPKDLMENPENAEEFIPRIYDSDSPDGVSFPTAIDSLEKIAQYLRK